MELLVNPQVRDFRTLQLGGLLRFAGQPTGKGSGYKQFQRAQWLQGGRLDENGQRINHSAKNWSEYYRYLQGVRGTAGAWKFLGPSEHKLGPSGSPLINHLFTGGLGRVNSIVPSAHEDGVLYAGTASGGIWRSTAAGMQWEPLMDGYPAVAISDIAVQEESTTLYAMTGDGDGFILPSIGVVKSTDGGVTWFQTGLSWGEEELNYGYRLLLSPADPNTLVAATSRGIYVTHNGGDHWHLVLPGRMRDVQFKPDDPSVVYAASTTGVFRSVDGAKHWKPVYWGLPAPASIDASLVERVELAVTPLAPNVVYAVFGGPSGTLGGFIGLFRSADAGQTFSMRSNTPNILGSSPAGDDTISHPWYDLAIVVSPKNPEEIYVGSINIWKSPNAGVSWRATSFWLEQEAKEFYVHPDIHDLKFVGGTLYAATDGGVYRMTANSRWEDCSSGLGITEIFRIAVHRGKPDLIYFGAQDNGTNRLEGTTAVQVWGGDGGQCHIDEKTPSTIYLSSQFGFLMRSTDAGLNALPISPPGQQQPQANYVTPFVLHPSLPGVLFAGYSDLWMGIVSSISAPTWLNVSNGVLGQDPAVQVAVAPSNPAIVYVAKPQGVFQGILVGMQFVWLQRSAPWPSNLPAITGLAVSAVHANHIWITLGGYSQGNKVFESTDAGVTWKNISGTLPNVPANVVEFESGQQNGIYVGMDVGVYYRNDSLRDWIPFNEGLPNVVIHDLDVHASAGVIRVATYGRGVWESLLFQEMPAAGWPVDAKKNAVKKNAAKKKARRE